MKKLLIKNLQRLKIASVHASSFAFCSETPLTRRLLFLLSKEKFILGVKKVSLGSLKNSGRHNFFQVFLNLKEKNFSLCNIAIISTPSKPVYLGWRELAGFFQKKEILIVSTSQGILTHKQCLSLKTGGKILCVLG